jgi:spermidine/putrescine-binding protein
MRKRLFLIVSLMFIISLIVAACAPAATPPPAPEKTQAPEPVKTEAPAAQVGGQLNILGWEGYDDPTVFKPFYDENKVVPNSTYIGNNDEVISKYKAGGPGVYDIGNINSRYLTPMIEQGMLMPLDNPRSQPAKIARLVRPPGRGDDGGAPFGIPRLQRYPTAIWCEPTELLKKPCIMKIPVTTNPWPACTSGR